ncbi:N-acetylmuramoyl-L-alanine amidase [Brevibacillus aydinogluensis]|uniref:Spore cortex-lytic enzyme n=2 Tax=Brevibacillus TaxID=55080 RepID=A0AA48M6X6_9BACL|nr:N-acetylmuramoyl-L-alanine amidase [Brevibacillus aydinogluensis]CAJ1001774.1 spore cortex-lytic enzyme [Brevibacillus aydinogluensis]
MFKRKPLTSLLLTLVVALLMTAAPASAAPLLKQGSKGGDVWDLQYRLQVLGYYQQPLDGKFGPHTRQAVKQFQRNYGLVADGIAGRNTWRTLKKVSVNREEMILLARLVHAEARGEPYVGQVAVAAVVMNRLQSPQFPHTIKGIIFEPYAFTAVDDGQFWLAPNQTAYRAAYDAVRGWDPSGGALYYFNPATATSRWIWSRPQIKRIGQHIFAR